MIPGPADDERRVAAWAAAVPPPDREAAARARTRQAQLVKPAGALGRLEEVAERIAAITGQERPRCERRLVAVFAADHGIVAEGVSAYPSDVTALMVRAFAAGTAAVAILARQAGARLAVVDVGVAAPLEPELPILHRKVRHGTASFVSGPAMSRAEALAAIVAGGETVEDALRDGLDLLAIGEMGIGNTTAAAAVAAALLGLPPAAVTGRGAGVDDAGLDRKRAAIERALALHRPDPADPVGVVAAVGGLEIAAMAGAILAAAANRVPVVLDGFIAGAAALLAARIAPDARHAMIAAHRSPEPGHRPILSELALEPMVDLGLRLGEASGAAIGLLLIDAALATHDGMATFAEAGIPLPAEALAVRGGPG